MSTSRIVKLLLQADWNNLPGMNRADDQKFLVDVELVGERIRQLRKALRMKQKDLAEAIAHGMTPQKLNNYEKGRNMIPPHEAGRLCGVTGARFDYIYGGQITALPSDLMEAVAKVKKAESEPKRRRVVKRA